jgi:HTH-type transcriptional regulator, sugar sensing transcriptional regulator
MKITTIFIKNNIIKVKMEEILREIGLTNTEVKVYLALLDLGSGLAGEITKKSEVNRTNVYDALERLMEKGLATYVISANRKVFEAVTPERLKEILEEKTNKLNKILPQLKQIYKESKTKEEATIFKGKKGIKSVFEDVLKENKEVYVYGAESRFADMFPAYQKHWNDRRAKQKIKLSIIFNEKVKEKKIKEKLKLTKMKFIPKNYNFPATIMIYGDKVVTTNWTTPPIAFQIKSKGTAKSNLSFFNILWKISNQ